MAILFRRGEATAKEIQDELLDPPTYSAVRALLATMGNKSLVTARKESRFIYYTANFERMSGLLAYLTENCCSLGMECAPACTPGSAPERKRKSA